MESEVYILNNDTSHSEDPGYDAFCWDKQNFLDLPSRMCMDKKYIEKSAFELPQKLFFQANFDLIPLYDFPYTDLNILIMSKKMLQTFTAIESFDYRTIKICMIDFTYLDFPFENDGSLKKDVSFCDDY